MQALHERVSRLETLLGEFIVHTDMALTRLENEMQDFKDEMKEFKDRVDKSISESERDRKEMNKQWGALANKMGTLVEDIISPASRPVIKKYFDCGSLDKSTRISRQRNENYFEVDVVLADIDRVFMIEVRSTPRVEYVQEILDKASEFKNFFSEYSDRKVIPIFASLTFDNNVTNYATKKGLYLMAYREWEYMDIINFDEVKKNTKE
jgi:hypothetical protein